jgi:Predicted flavin-nucleotide-binding protein structurally related to pyridoxine 5''-phosphate oxidase
VEGFDQEVSRRELETVLRGSIPMAIATASSEAKSNVTYVSRVHIVDDERIALSNQFLGKTKRNLAENPRASLLAICPSTYSQYRIDVTFEQSLRSGSVFDELRKDIQALAALGQATKHFELLSADIFRVNRVAKVFETDADRQRRDLNSESPPISVTLLRSSPRSLVGPILRSK